MPELPVEGPINWKDWVTWLAEVEWPMPSTELTDAGTVFHGLEQKTAFVTGPLRAAAGRKFTSITPGQQSRFAVAIARGDATFEVSANSQFLSLMRVLSLQLEAALAAGKEKEAAELVPLLFTVRDLLGSDVSLIDLLIRNTADRILADALQRNLAAGLMPSAALEEFQRGFAARPVLDDMDRLLNMELAWSCYMMDQVVKQRASWDTIKFFFQDPKDFLNELIFIAEKGFSCLSRLNKAAAIRIFLDNIHAWKTGGLAGYYRAVTTRDEQPERSTFGTLLHLDSFLVDGAARGMSSLAKRVIHTEMRRRVLLIACGLERHRLAGNTPPPDLPGLPKNLLAAIPSDLDGKPLRYRRNEDGWVIWSVGLDLQDDLKGEAPPQSQKDSITFADWQWRYKNTDRR